MSDEQNKKSAAAVLAASSKKKSAPSFTLSDDPFETMEKSEDPMLKAGYDSASPHSPLMAALQKASGNSNANKKAPQLAFTENPTPSDNYLGLYKSKRRLLPDEVIKLISVQDHLVAAILRARGSMMSLFGHLRKDRFDVGIEIEIKPEFFSILTPEQYTKVTARMKRAEQLLLNCGHTEGLEHQQQMTLADFLDMQGRNGLRFGRFATEIIRDRDGQPDENGVYPFHRFRPIDVATIVRAVRKGESVGNSLRQTAMTLLESLSGDKTNIDMNKLKEDEYAWLQVVDGQPRQAFTHEEMLVYNLFDSTDIEHNGYPVSPLDTVISSVTTHISIDAYKKLYFQNGRASKGMLVIKSDEVDESVLNSLKLQFNAAVNSVSNSFRTPIFGMGKEDEVEWVSMVGEGMNGSEFQFMYDQVARNILSAFSISPDELPGYAHLSRGTNSQTLSESNNEFKLTAARDTGLRPLILKFQTFFNQRLLPIIDPQLAKICEIRFEGLDAQSKEQESTRLQQDMPTHMTYDEVLHDTDKEPIGKHLGGKYPFNERIQLIHDKYLNVSDILGPFFGNPSAAIDPMLKYKRDPFFLQWLQLMAETNPNAVKAYFAPKPFALEFLKMNIEDELEGEDSERN